MDGGAYRYTRTPGGIADLTHLTSALYILRVPTMAAPPVPHGVGYFPRLSDGGCDGEPFRPADAARAANWLHPFLVPEHRYFKVAASDGDTYVLRHDEASGEWTLGAYRKGGG